MFEDCMTKVDAHKKVCPQLKSALDDGKIGDIVAQHQELILNYYRDVLVQANKSFNTARFVATLGFFVLIGSLISAIAIDSASHIKNPSAEFDKMLTVAIMGTVSGALIEFIAGVTFWLYARVARQFGAFHICLERTHRYLIAFKITEQMKEKDKTLHDLVCIMANAPMITREDIESDFRKNTK